MSSAQTIATRARMRPLHVALLVAAVLFAFGLRVWRLDDVPAGLYCDEAGNGYNAYTLGTAGVDENGVRFPLYVWSFGTAYKNPLFIYGAILPVKLFGPSAFSVRLAAALFGTATVLAMFFLGRAMFGFWVGLWAALFLAVVPWHLHFSRIAFELIAFPLIAVAGCTLLVRFTQGRRTLPAALGVYALGVYAYAPAAFFVPAFLVGFGVLFLPELLRRWRQFLLALVVAAAVLTPAALFFSSQGARTGTQYFRRTTFVDVTQPWREQAERFGRNYAQFFSPRFLVHEGDPIFRHAVRDFGELYPFFVPFVVLGAGVALLRRDRVSKLLLWWLLLYPVAPSLMNEIPSATRGIIGAPILCLLAGVGFAAGLRALRFLAPRRRWGVALQTAAALAGLAYLGVEVGRYLHAYFVEYPTYAALTPGAFQFGYRDAIAYMESERANYDVLLLSATDANQPQIFPQFYRPIPPRDWMRTHDTGYLIIKPEDFLRRDPKQRVLAALHPDDVDLFSDLQVKRLIEGPGGKLAFVVAEIGARKRYLTDWLILGLFANDDGRGGERDFIDPANLAPSTYAGLNGVAVKWRQATPRLASVDLNRDFIGADPRNPANPERVCAYAATTIRSPTARPAVLELSSSLNDTLRVWLNGRPLTPFPMMMGREPRQRDIELRQGDNGLVLQTCEDIGTWDFSARILDANGHDMEDLVAVAQLPIAAMQTPPAAADAVQLVDGYAGGGQGQVENAYPDYRGGSPSWRARVENHSSVSWRTAPPAVAAPTVFAFTGSTSDEEGDFNLAIDGRPTLTFRSHRDREVHSWTGGGATLVYVPKGSAAGSTGYYLLSVPAEQITPGVPVELRVTGSAGDPAAWFMIKSYRDTVGFEHLRPVLAAEATRGTWRTRALAFSTRQ